MGKPSFWLLTEAREILRYASARALGASAQNDSRSHFLRRLSTAAFAVTLIAGVVAVKAQSAASQAATGQSPSASADRPSFDVASVKANKGGDNRVMMRPQPGGRFTATNVTPAMLINLAYDLKPHQMVGGPDWINSEHFDIEAKADGNPPKEQMNLMMQSLLADRFKLAAHHDTRQLPVYLLVLSKTGKTGPQLTPHTDDSKCPDISAGPPPPPRPGAGPPPIPCGGFFMMNGHMAAQKVTIESLARSLNNFVDRIVLDKTGLSGNFDVDFSFTGTQSPFGGQRGPDAGASDPAAPPSIFTALQEQLGLKLESQTAPVDVLVIDHVERPSEN
jgi:uncharacterized protein (TIGR03435 family)